MVYADEYIVKTEKLTAIADSIREKTGETDTITIDEMPNKMDEVFEAGKNSQYDEFWGIIQNYGQSKNFSQCFSTSQAWNDSTFNPRFDFICTNAAMMFQYSKITKLAEKLKERNLKLDTSACVQTNQMFQGAAVKDVPKLDIQKAIATSYMFGSSPKVETIEGLIFSQKTGSNSSTNMFEKAQNLTHCIFQGEIAIALDLHWSTLLDKESILSFVNALSTTKSGLTTTLSLTAVNKAFETSEGANDG
jgi:hypothetical protein